MERLRQQCRRAEERSSTLTIVRVSATSDLAVRQLAARMRIDLSDGFCDNDEYEFVFAGRTREDLCAIVRDAQRELAQVRIGMAECPRDASSPETLRALARARLESSDDKDCVENATVVVDGEMREVHKLARTVAGGSISVLILGETGTGKEVLARTIHAHSPRANAPFLALNCAAFSETLLESELFGYERGAFTGAVQSKEGLLESAAGGTVFLDEIGEMPAPLQAKLLRVVDEKRVRRVGGLKERAVDVRLVSATNRNPAQDVASGMFRADLLYRLNGVTLHLPPLRERRSEIEPLSKLFLDRFARSLGVEISPKLSFAALDVMLGYAWPGNVRELRNVLERAVLLCGASAIQPSHLGIHKPTMEFSVRAVVANAPEPMRDVYADPYASRREQSYTDLRAVAEGQSMSGPALQLMEALNHCGGNQTRAARMLGISRGTLISRIIQYGLPRPRTGRQAASKL